MRSVPGAMYQDRVGVLNHEELGQFLDAERPVAVPDKSWERYASHKELL